MRKLGALLAAAAICATPALAAKPPKTGGSLTITSSAGSVTFGRTVTISGAATGMPAGTTVQLQENPFPYRGFKATGKSGVVDPSGNYSIPGVAPQVHTQYRTVAKASPPAQSAATTVRVRLRVAFRVSDRTPKRGARVRFFGTVAPAHDGKPVLIQKRTSRGYRTVARTTLLDNGTATSKYSKRLRIRARGTYRVVAESLDQDHDNGRSRRQTLRVH